MKLRSASHAFVFVLCVLALLVAQTSGGPRIYVCFCGGKPLMTQSSHCYGPHSAECHVRSVKDDATHDETDPSSREDHEAVDQSMLMRPVETASQMVMPQVLVAILPPVQVLPGAEDAKVAATYAVDFGESPPLGVTVASTVVLLI